MTTTPRPCTRCDRPARPGRLTCSDLCARRAAAAARRQARARLTARTVAQTPVQHWLALDDRPPLTAEAEAALARRALTGDAEARTELVMRNVKIILKKIKGSQDRRQAALLAAVRAAAKYNPDALYGRKTPQRLRFTTYVGWHGHWAALAADAAAKVPEAPAEPGQVVRLDSRGDPRRSRTLEALAAAEAADRAAEAADRAEAAADRAEAAAAALAAMTPMQRAVMEAWAASAGRTAADIAAELGITETQAYGYRRRATARAREARHDRAA